MLLSNSFTMPPRRGPGMPAPLACRIIQDGPDPAGLHLAQGGLNAHRVLAWNARAVAARQGGQAAPRAGRG